jgi:hypothetical protein
LNTQEVDKLASSTRIFYISINFSSVNTDNNWREHTNMYVSELYLNYIYTLFAFVDLYATVVDRETITWKAVVCMRVVMSCEYTHIYVQIQFKMKGTSMCVEVLMPITFIFMLLKSIHMLIQQVLVVHSR